MALVRSLTKSGITSKSGLGKVGVSTSKVSIDTPTEKTSRLQEQRYEKAYEKKYEKEREEQIGNVLETLKKDFQAESVIKEGDIIKVKKGIEEYQFKIGDQSIDYVDKVFDIPKDMVKSGNTYYKNPLVYTSLYDKRNGDKDIKTATYKPYEVILDEKGNVKSEIWRKTFEEYDSKDEDSKKERRKTYISKRKDYKDGELVSEKEWDDFTTVKQKNDDERFEKKDIFLESEKLYEKGALIKERKWDDYRDEIDKYDKGYRYEYDTYLKKDIDYKTGLVGGDAPDPIKVTDYAAIKKIEEYEYKDPYIAILERQKKSLTPEAQKRQDQSITERKIKEINKVFGTQLKSPYVQITAPGAKSTFNPVKGQETLDIVSYVGSSQPKNVKQLIYQTSPTQSKKIYELDNNIKQFESKLKSFDKTPKDIIKQKTIIDKNLYGASLVTKAPERESANWFTRTTAKMKESSTPTFRMGGMGMPIQNNNMFKNLNQTKIKKDTVPNILKNDTKLVFGNDIFSEQSKLDIKKKIF